MTSWAEDTQDELAYQDAETWVAEWLSEHYCRSLDDPGRAWCDQWTEHPEAVSRLSALWSAWERAHHDDARMVTWWLNADSLLGVLLDERGPFSACRKGHSARLGALPTRTAVPTARNAS